MEESSFVNGYAIQIPIWVALAVLAVVLFGGWKLAKAIWAALSN